MQALGTETTDKWYTHMPKPVYEKRSAGQSAFQVIEMETSCSWSSCIASEVTVWCIEYPGGTGPVSEHYCYYYYYYYYLLTPWSRVLLEKLTGLQLVKKFPAFY
jgi:hypothetical protein